VVDELLRTSSPGVYAAGDVANFYNPDLDKRLRVEHEDNANTMGLLAGRNMAGAAEPYHHLPFSTRTFSSWAMKQSGWWMRVSRRWPTEMIWVARASSTICGKARCAGCFCGMSGDRLARRGA
jgi:hypothetical protein